MRGLAVLLVTWVLAAVAVPPATAAECGDGAAGFASWLAHFKAEATSEGISAGAVAALDHVSYDPRIIHLDRNQHVFHESFAVFSAHRVTSGAIAEGVAKMHQHADVLDRIEHRFGVPGPVVVAIWGLETGFGAGSGNLPTLTALATLAYDCRRSAMFRTELTDALRLIERGDLRPDEMRGAWAGEMGQTQFMPSSYLKYAVDFDGNGHANLITSAPDALASTANYLKGYGWHAGKPWDEGSANFAVLKQWNKSTVYCETVAYFADKLAAAAGRRLGER